MLYTFQGADARAFTLHLPAMQDYPVVFNGQFEEAALLDSQAGEDMRY